MKKPVGGCGEEEDVTEAMPVVVEREVRREEKEKRGPNKFK